MVNIVKKACRFTPIMQNIPTLFAVTHIFCVLRYQSCEWVSWIETVGWHEEQNIFRKS